jgi:hypothetical protein
MRKLVKRISIIIFGCSPKSNAVDSIEIMSYYYSLSESQTKLKTEPVACSIIYVAGNVDTIQKIPF